MKKIINILGISAMLLAFTSCEDWLDMPSESKADSSTIFETVGRAEMTVVGAYPSLFTQELNYQLLMGTDESGSTESNSKYDVSNYVYTTSTIVANTYKSMYAAIEYANVCIKNLPKMSVTSDAEQKKINSLLGESLAIRAYAYWNLVRFFGDVPYSDVPVADLNTFSSSRVSRDTIYDHCIADLQRAVELLPWKSEGAVATPERFTKNAAYGILARVALYAAGYSLRWDLNTVPYSQSTVQIAQRNDANRIKELYQIAADACSAVISKNENGLVDNYDQVFRDLCLAKYNEETMLEYGCRGANSPDVRIGYTSGISINSKNVTFGKGGAQMVAMPTLYFEFEEGDQRRDVSVCNYGILADDSYQMNTYMGNAVGKYRVTWKKDIGTSASRRDINWPLLRYSDVLLMYAEALNELNNAPTTEAVNAFKAVRMRAFRGDESKIGRIPADYDGFKEAIILERKLELSNESLRKTDLTRWGILYEHLTAEKEKLYQLANREGKYANIDVYRAYKAGKAVLEDPTIAVPYVALNESDLALLNLKPEELEALKVLNTSDKGFVKANFYEDEDGKVYFTEASVPAGKKKTKVAYTIVNMFGAHSTMGKGQLSVKEVENVSGVNTWITNMFAGLKKNCVEILPLSTTAIIDVNPGLAGQQHPCY